MNIQFNFFHFLLIAITTVVLSAGCASTSQTGAKTSNKWRIEFSEGANSDGVIVFRVTPIGGQPTNINASITDGTRENRVASEDVLVKRRGDTPNFSLELVSNSVKSVRIDIERE